MTKVDFSASAKRHYQDALLLEANGRQPNSGQLFGFCAECGIKALLISQGYPTDSDGSPIKKPPSGETGIREHINRLVIIKNQIEASTSGRSGAKYLALIPNIGAFSDWSVDHRYYDQAQIPASLLKWKEAAIEIMEMMDIAFSDGVLK